MNISPISYNYNKVPQTLSAAPRVPSFKMWCKGESWAEKSFVEMIRKQRVSHSRKFTEFDVADFLSGLRKFKDVHEGIAAFRDLLYFAFHETDTDAPLMKKIYTLISGRDEEQRFAIFEYAKFCQDNGASGFDVMCTLPEDTQNELIGILTKLNGIECKDTNYEKMQENIFSNFNILVYAYDDMRISNGRLSDSYKIENFLMLHDAAKEGEPVMKEMEEYFIEKFMR